MLSGVITPMITIFVQNNQIDCEANQELTWIAILCLNCLQRENIVGIKDSVTTFG